MADASGVDDGAVSPAPSPAPEANAGSTPPPATDTPRDGGGGDHDGSGDEEADDAFDVDDAEFADADQGPEEVWQAGPHDAEQYAEYYADHDDARTVSTIDTALFADATAAPPVWSEPPVHGAVSKLENAYRIGQLLLEEAEEASAAVTPAASPPQSAAAPARRWAKAAQRPEDVARDPGLAPDVIAEHLKEMGNARRLLDLALTRYVQQSAAGATADASAAGTDDDVTSVDDSLAARAAQTMRNAECKDDYLDGLRLSLFPAQADGSRRSIPVRRALPTGLAAALPSATASSDTDAGPVRGVEETKAPDGGAADGDTAGDDSDGGDGGGGQEADATPSETALAPVREAVADALRGENALLSDAVAEGLAAQLVDAGLNNASRDAYDAVARVLANPSLVNVLAEPNLKPPVPEVVVGSGRYVGRWGCGASIRTTYTYRVVDTSFSPEEWLSPAAVWSRVTATVELEAYVSSQRGRLLFGHSHVAVTLVDPKAPRPVRSQDEAAAAQREAAAAARAGERALVASADVDDGDDDGTASTAGSAAAATAGTDGSVVTDGSGAAAAIVPAPDEEAGEGLPLHTQLYAWGRGQYGALGMQPGEDNVVWPSPVSFGQELGMVRVAQVAASWFHTAAVTDMGLMYTWGSGADGALGHGTTESLAYPRLVEYFGLVHPLFVRSVSCGSEVLGTHTAVVASEADGRRRVFTWGLGTALGIGTSKSQWSPQEVASTELNAPSLGGIASVSCGGGFTAAVTKSGALFTWGKWANGRLGLGSPPVSRQGKAVQRVAVHPMRVTRLAGTVIRQVATGEAHSLALDAGGGVWAFGKGASGQLGTGWTSDCLWPVAVHVPSAAGGGYDAASDAGASTAASTVPVAVKVVKVAAGAAHSAAIGADGALYTWGGAGGLMIGHGDRLMEVGVSKAAARAAAKAGDRLGWKRPWLKPRKLLSLAGTNQQRLVHVSCGATHMAALAVSGQLYVWGDNEYGTLGNGGHIIEPLPRLVGCSDAVSTRGGPGAMGAGLSGEYVTTFACGGWHTVAVSSSTFLGRDLRSALPRLSGVHGLYRSSSDMVLIVERQKLPCHKAILSARSSTFRDRILAEEARGLVPHGTKMELVVPDLSLETAVALLEFIYTDNVSIPLTPLSPNLPRLFVAADTYRLPRLSAMCQLLLKSPFADILRREQRRKKRRPTGGDADDDDADADELLAGALADATADQGAALAATVQSKGLDGDMEGALVEAPFADLWFTCGGDKDLGVRQRRTAAHQVILCARSQYFNALFLGSMQGGSAATTNDDAPPDGVEVEAPDAPVTLARLLHYLYTGVLSPAPTDQLLQDLVAADRFGITHLKSMCESVIGVTVDNAARVLELADVVSAHRLREAALCFMVQHLAQVSASSSFEVLSQRNAVLMEELLARAQQRNDAYFGVLASGEGDGDSTDKAEADKDGFKQEPFPWKHLCALLALLVAYRAFSHYNTAMTNFVPALNVCVVLGTIVYTLYTMRQ